MSVIKLMDEKLANMIAAGEVVERPASIIKELVENSIDAKATNITITVTDNGLKSIKVLDNGVGMSKEDAQMAFLRHATSKISTKYDLERIRTLGFRGEALAAILSVSKVTVKTKQANNEGIYLSYENSKLIDEGLATMNDGTEFTISSLFYNTPARLKYLKSEFTERAVIIDTFDRLALSNPNIRFTLIMDDKLVKETYGNADYYSLISQIYGQSILKDLKYFENEFAKIKVKGYLASPMLSRSRRKDISIFVNGRYIKNYALTQAIIDGYHSFLMTNKYPLAIIIIEMDPVLLDVNVHPQKLEVKFTNESLIKFQLETFIKETLINFRHEIPQNISMVTKDISKNETFTRPSLDFSYNQELVNNTNSISSNFILNEEKNNVKNEVNENTSLKKLPEMDYIGTLDSTYLLFQNEEGMYLVDQHAAEERVNYEYYYNKIDDIKIIESKMLLPRQMSLTTHDFEVIEDNIEEFNKYGFRFNSDNELLTHPNFILDKDLELTINELISMLEEDKKISLKKLLDQLAKDKSCKASIKAHDKISRIEIDELMMKLRQTNNPYTCPHGRPTIILLTHYDIEKMFKRVVL